jgi:hypothetical protein
VASGRQAASAPQLWDAFTTHAFIPRPLTHATHACVAVFGSVQAVGIVLPMPPHCVKQGAAASQTQLLTT